MSVPGFLAARGGSSGVNKGFSSWQPALTTLGSEDLEGSLGQSRSHRGGFNDIALNASHDVTVFRKPIGAINKKLMTLAYFLGHQAGSVDEAIKGLVLAYWAIDSAGIPRIESLDLTILTNSLDATGIKGGVTQIVGPTTCVLRTTNSSATSGGGPGTLDYAVWATTFERDVGVISGGG